MAINILGSGLIFQTDSKVGRHEMALPYKKIPRAKL
jgi:hypothetical protein